MRRQLKRAWRELDTRRRMRRNTRRAARASGGPPVLAPIWPLPRAAGGPSDAEVQRSASRHPFWLYGFDFEGGLAVPGRAEAIGRRGFAQPERPLQRFRHFMPWLLAATGGSLRGKRVLDIACNAGFWSVQCALLGACEVVGFDARSELIEQAELIKSITGIDNVRFRTLDFWAMSPAALDGPFDVVLNLGLLYHLAKPVEALEATKRMARGIIVLDTAVHEADQPLIHVRWEEPEDIRSAARSGIALRPSKPSLELMLRHVGFSSWREIPLRSPDMPEDYRTGRRATWLIRV